MGSVRGVDVSSACLHGISFMRPPRRWAPRFRGTRCCPPVDTGFVQHRMGLLRLLSGSSTCNCRQAFLASFPLLCALHAGHFNASG